MNIPVVYDEKQVADTGLQPLGEEYVQSPSARKPKEMAAYLTEHGPSAGINPVFLKPDALTRADLKRCHDHAYVDDILDLKAPNGFDTFSQSVADSLPYTNGAMYTAAKAATAAVPTCALVSGFHHAGYKRWRGLGWFCTFNGLMATAMKLVHEDGMKRVAIVDCDMHWGNGTDDILIAMNLLKDKRYYHNSFGRRFTNPSHAESYLSSFQTLEQSLATNRPDIILYQAGADVHVNDPYGGVLTTEQMIERDLKMFKIAKKLSIPVAWNLAGGYQVEPDGSIEKVLRLHMNTFLQARTVYE